MCNLTFKDGKMLSFYREIDSPSTVLNEFQMHSAFCKGLVRRCVLFDVKSEEIFSHSHVGNG